MSFSFDDSGSKLSLLSYQLFTKPRKVDSEYEEWKEKIRIIITSFSAAAAGKYFSDSHWINWFSFGYYGDSDHCIYDSL